MKIAKATTTATKRPAVTLAAPETKVQWGTRLHPAFRRSAKIVSAMTDLSQDDLAELGLAVLFGLEVESVKICRSHILEAARRSGVELPTKQFEEMVRGAGFEPATPTVSR